MLDSENATGSVEVTMTGNGQTMNGHASYTGKGIGAGAPSTRINKERGRGDGRFRCEVHSHEALCLFLIGAANLSGSLIVVSRE